MKNYELNLNKLNNRIFMISPIIKDGLDIECTKNDFNREGESSIELGCLGKAWKVIHKKTEKVYAIKVIHKDKAVKRNLQDAINKQLEVMYRIKHSNILRLLNHFEDEENLYLVFQSGGDMSLFDKMTEMEVKEENAYRYIKEVASALLYLNSLGIYSSEISSEAVLLDENDHVKITDYGWSTVVGGEPTRRRSVLVQGITLTAYMSPEVVQGKINKSPLGNSNLGKASMWQLGVLLFELLTGGHPPFLGKSTDDFVKNLESCNIAWELLQYDTAKTLLSKMLVKNPNERIDLNTLLEENLLKSITPSIPDFDHDEAVINKKRSSSRNTSLASYEQLIVNLKKENAKLKEENQKLKTDYDELLKKNNISQNNNFSSPACIEELSGCAPSLTDDNLAFYEEKLKIHNKDRESQELEEKFQNIVELRSKIRMLENDIELYNMNLSEAQAKNEDYQTQIMRLMAQLEMEKVDKETSLSTLNSKIEIMENQLFNTTTDCLNQEEFFKNFTLLTYDSIKQFKDLVQKLVSVSKEDHDSLLKNMREFLDEKENTIRDSIAKAKDAFENEIFRKTNKSVIRSSVTFNAREEWMQKQIQELIPFKQKCIVLEESKAKYEKEHKILSEKLELSELNVQTVQKINKEIKIVVENLKGEITKIENKLSDSKDFIVKNCPDKMEDYFLICKI